MKKTKKPILIVSLALAFIFAGSQAWSAPDEKVPADSRCPVCGMFVAKYPNWQAQIRHADEKIAVFDGVKDLLAYYFEPGRFGSYKAEQIKEIWVKDYYSLQWVDARQAFFVTGSDVHGPMGHEFIVLSTRKGAEAFLKDHKGDRLLAFDEITPDLVNAMRAGHMMK